MFAAVALKDCCETKFNDCQPKDTKITESRFQRSSKVKNLISILAKYKLNIMGLIYIKDMNLEKKVICLI